MIEKQAQAAAIKCADEIINSWLEDGNHRLDKGVIYHWKEVKQELIEMNHD